jgi:hypothetical protein
VLQRQLVLVLTLSLIAAGGLAGCGGGETSETTTVPSLPITTTETQPTETAATETTTTTEASSPVVVRVTVLGGAPQGGIVRESARKGDRVVLQVRSDEADEVHVHGYDLYRDVAPGAPARIAFVADVPGRFAVELHHHGTQIAELTVRP